MAGEGQGRGLLLAGGILLVLGIAGVGIAIGVFISPASQLQDEIEALKGQLKEAFQVQDEQIVISTSFRCPEGAEGSSRNEWCIIFLATNILSLDVDRWNDIGGEKSAAANYWLSEDRTVEDQGFVMSLGNSSTVWGVSLRNTHNSGIRDRSTKKFKVLGGATASGPWEELHVADLVDSRRQNPPPEKQIRFANPAVVSFIKFELLEYYGNGGGLQYFVPIYRAK